MPLTPFHTLAESASPQQSWLYAAFVAMIGLFLALDLGLLNRRPHAMSVKQALAWTTVWVSVALGFAALVYYMYEQHWLGLGLAVPQLTDEAPRDVAGAEAMGLFLVAWGLEYALSLDNIFVIAVIFKYFKVPKEHQHRVLFWGILGAVLLRGAFISLGVQLLNNMHWIIYVLGAFLVYTSVHMIRDSDAEVHPDSNPLAKLARRVFPLSPGFDGQKFFTVANGRRMMTPMFLVLLVVETTDVVFAVDSIPAVFGITRDPFIVFTSNIFAILGLRSLYFALAAVMGKFVYLKYCLAFILAFIGVKMLLPLAGVHISHTVSLGSIGAALLVGILSSVVFASRIPAQENAPAQGEPGREDSDQNATGA
ncbi:MAG: TerC family protein [Planctomycetes bacterium]|nr:TerC family protein [Planctomycetota bacterium]